MTTGLSSLVVDLRILVVLLCCAIRFNGGDAPLRPKEMVSLLEEGKRQYNLIQSKTTMPSFGTCWKEAVHQLHSGCQHLDDRIQRDVALAFANCFLEGAGLSKHDCDRSEPLQKESCLKSMPDRAFIAYTEFFTHTQSMCFFIMSQVWHEETEKTIDKLSSSAADVARQLEASEELQSELLLQQRQSVLIQQELLDNGVSLGSMLHESRDSLNLIFNEFRMSTLEQQRLLSMVFHHLSTLQSWIVGEVSWVDSIAFYIPSFAFVYFLTSAQRTANGRIPGLITLLCAGLIERLVSYILLNDAGELGSFQPVDVINERLSWWVWLVRRFAIAANTGWLLFTLYRYRDREEVMHQLLEQIRRQNEELLRHIQGGKDETKEINRTGSMDETDALGYMPVLATSSSSLSGHDSSPSSNSGLVGFVNQIGGGWQTRPATLTNGVVTPLRTVNFSIPNEHSAFRPIREVSPTDATSISVDERSEASTPVASSSTPKAKSKQKSRRSDSSPANSRYNLRRSRNLVASPV